MMTSEGLHEMKVCKSCIDTLAEMQADAFKAVKTAKKEDESDGI